MIFGVENIFSYGNLLVGAVEISFGLLVFVNLIFLRLRKQKWIYKAGSVMMLSMLVPLIVLLFSGGIGGTGIYWFFVYIPLAFFVNEKWDALIWTVLIFAVLALTMTASFAGVASPAYTTTEIRQLMVSLGVLTIIVYYFSEITSYTTRRIDEEKEILEQYVKDLQKTSTKLREKTKEMQKLNELMVGRELKMIELKKQLKEKK